MYICIYVYNIYIYIYLSIYLSISLSLYIYIYICIHMLLLRRRSGLTFIAIIITIIIIIITIITIIIIIIIIINIIVTIMINIIVFTTAQVRPRRNFGNRPYQTGLFPKARFANWFKYNNFGSGGKKRPFWTISINIILHHRCIVNSNSNNSYSIKILPIIVL